MNATDSRQRSRVYRGLRNIQDVGRVTEYAGKRDIGVWGDGYCDRFRGTDGTVFPPCYDPRGRDSVVVYVPSFCREVNIIYEAPSELKGIETLRYRTGVGPDWRQDPRVKCYSCEAGDAGAGEDSCLPRGVYDLYRCIKAPLVLTNPHFYDVDEVYASRVEGLEPEKERHAIFAEQDPFTGGLLVAYIRFQLNLFLRPVQKIKLARNFPEALLPLFWLDEHIIVPEWLRRELRVAHFVLKSVKVIVHLMIVGGLGLLAFTFYKDYRTTKFSAKKVRSTTSSQKRSPMEVKTMFESDQEKTQELAVSLQKPTFVLPTPMK
uniref:Sensory neuron membrane protein 1 n=1 Tax=Trichogramma kaykai TaxID=54128 RepID=A0ABD2XJ81_9HYME